MSDSVVVVTGALTGIGEATASAFAQGGNTVVVSGRHDDVGEQLARDLKRAGCPPLESYEVLRAIEETGQVHLRLVELQTRLAVPRNRMSRLIDRLVREGYVEREKAASDQRGYFVVITDLGRRASKEASTVLLAALRQFFYGTK